MTTNYMDIHIQIGQEMLHKVKAPQVDVIVWDLP